MAWESGPDANDMAGENLSLIDYLSRPNPTINSDYSWTGVNTNSTKAKGMRPNKDFIDWKDFNHDTLQAIYGEVLKLEFPQQELPDYNRHLPFHRSEIHDEDSLEALLIIWNNAVVSRALSVAQRSLRLSSSDTAGYATEEIFMARGGHAMIPGVKAEKSPRPDWAGIIPSVIYQGKNMGRKSYSNVLPGESKLSTKWKTSLDPDSLQYKKPFFQLFKYCELANVRYGYLLTQEELVVVRVSRKPRDQVSHSTPSPKPSQTSRTAEWKEEQAKLSLPETGRTKQDRMLEFKSIPWVNESEGKEGFLSINLALWALHMMAATARSIGPEYRDLQNEYQIQDTASMKRSPPDIKRSVAKGKKRPQRK
ncbi:hypothetical protein MMC16_006930 [Acarospora aff. strigata]|nr:hypothetical protein [Acarospora aff. strigata]